MPTQDSLFVTDIYDALADIVRASGGPKKVGCELRPDKPGDEASRWVKDCLNRDRREKFDPDQIMWLLRKGREVECHAAINFICADAGYAYPVPIEPEDELAQLLRAYLDIEQKRGQLHPKIEEARARLAVAK